MRRRTYGLLFGASIALAGCSQNIKETVDSKVARQQEEQQKEAHAQVPPPAIVNWHEMRQLKLIQEMRDNPKLQSYTYTKNLMDGSFNWVCDSIGFGLPYDTRSNNPNHFEYVTTPNGPRNNCVNSTTDGLCMHGEYTIMPQPEPNGLHIPSSAKGTWNICKNQWTGEPEVTYQEEDVAVFPYILHPEQVKGYNPHKDYAGSVKKLPIAQ